MGYYTDFEIFISDDLRTDDAIDIANMLMMHIKGNEINKNELIRYIEDYGLEFTINNYILNLPMKWYKHSEIMIDISKKYPTTKFRLAGIGEDSLDIWSEYYFNGESFTSQARVEFDKPPDRFIF